MQQQRRWTALLLATFAKAVSSSWTRRTCCSALCLCPEWACAQMLLMICWPLAFSMFGCSNAELSFKVWPVQHTEDHLCFTPSVFAANIQLGQLSCTTAVMLEKYQTWLLPPLCPIIYDVMPRYMLQWLHTSMHQWPSFHRLDKMGPWWKSVTGGEEVFDHCSSSTIDSFWKTAACVCVYEALFVIIFLWRRFVFSKLRYNEYANWNTLHTSQYMPCSVS